MYKRITNKNLLYMKEGRTKILEAQVDDGRTVQESRRTAEPVHSDDASCKEQGPQ
jgi:hypothetical protein